MESELLHHQQRLDMTSNCDSLWAQVSEMNILINKMKRNENKINNAQAAEMSKTHDLENLLGQFRTQYRCNALSDELLNLNEQLGNKDNAAWNTVHRNQPERSTKFCISYNLVVRVSVCHILYMASQFNLSSCSLPNHL